MTRPVTVSVTGEDIRRGLRNLIVQSPVHLAICRAGFPSSIVILKNKSSELCNLAVFSLPEEIYYSPTVVPDWIELPPEADRHTRQFNAGKKVLPFTFQIEVPDRW